MRFYLFITLAVVGLAIGAVGTVGAQTDAVENASQDLTSNETETEAPNGSDVQGIWIDENTRLLESEHLAEDGTARITIHSEIRQSVTLTDAGKFSTGGEVARRTLDMRPGDTATVELPVTVVDGLVGVGISTNELLWAEVIEARNTGSSPWEQTGPVAGWLGGASVFTVMMGIAAMKVKRKNPTAPEAME